MLLKDFVLHDELAHAEAMRNSEIGDYEEVRINTLTQSIYDKDNLYGILKLLDRFIDTVGKKRAIEIMEEFANEGN